MCLENLQPNQIPVEERPNPQPPELVAVLGSHCGRHWGEIYELGCIDWGHGLILSAGADAIRVWDLNLHELYRLDPSDRYGSAGPVAFSRAGTAKPKIISIRTDVGLNLRAAYFTENGLVDLPCDVIAPSAPCCLALSPDDRFVAVGCSGGEVLVELVQDNSIGPWAILTGENAPALSVSFSQNLLAVGFENGKVGLWIIKSPIPEPIGSFHSRFNEGLPIRSLAFSNNGETLALANGRVEVCKLQNGTPVAFSLLPLPDYEGAEKLEFATVAFSNDGMIAGGSGQGVVCIWKANGPMEEPHDLSTLSACDSGQKKACPVVFDIENVLMSENTLLTTEEGRAISFWSPQNFDGAAPFSNARADGLQPVKWLKFSRNGECLVSAHWIEEDPQLLSWPLVAQPIRAEKFPLPPAYAGLPLAYSPDGMTVALASSGGIDIRGYAPPAGAIWRQLVPTGFEPQNPDPLFDLLHHRILVQVAGIDVDFRPYLIEFLDDGRLVAAIKRTLSKGGEEASLWRFTLHENTASATRLGGITGKPVAISPDGQTVASRFYERGRDVVRLWFLNDQDNLTPGQKFYSVPQADFSDPVQWLAVAPKGERLASVDNRGCVRLWNGQGTMLNAWSFAGPSHSVAFAPDGRHLAVGNGNGTVYILRLVDSDDEVPPEGPFQ